MTIPICDLKPQYHRLQAEINAAMAQVLEDGAFILGPQVKSLESEVAAYCDCTHGVGVASGTDALHLALAAAGIKEGDEVITTSFSFVATGSAISRCGATPVFADIDPQTFNLDPAAVANAVSPRTRAIVPVHLYGQTCDMDALNAIAAQHGLLVIEDSAQAIGARWKGVPTGTLGDAAALSFFPTKNLGAYGDGGMVVTRRAEIAEKVDILRRQGARQKYRSEVVGLNSRLDTLQAAVLLVKLRYLEEWNTARRSAAAHYDELLAALPLETPFVREEAEVVFHQYTIRTPLRDQLSEFLKTRGIGTMIYYPVPIHLQNLYASLGYKPGSLPESEKASREVLSLPMFPEITSSQREQVAAAIQDFYQTQA